MFELQIAIIIHSFSPPQNCGHVFLANCGKRSTRISRSPITPPWPKRSESTIQATRRYQHHNKPLTHLQVYSQRRFNAVVGKPASASSTRSFPPREASSPRRSREQRKARRSAAPQPAARSARSRRLQRTMLVGIGLLSEEEFR
jgi:hypothetical protein